MTSRAIQLRLFLTCWIVYAAHFATNFVREHYLVVSMVEDRTFDLGKYLGLHVDIFENPPSAPHGGVHHGANPGISLLGAVPYAVLRPAVDAIVRRDLASRGPEDTLAVYRDETRPRRLAFYQATRRMGLDVRFGLVAMITAALCMAPLTAGSVVVVFRLISGSGASQSLALGLSLVYAFATPVFFRASYLNQNLGIAIFSIVAFLLLWNPGQTIRWRAGPRQMIAGFLGGFSFLSDYSGALSLGVLGAYLLWKEWEEHSAQEAVRAGLRYGLAALPPILALFYYQWASFGHAFYPPQHWMPPVEWIEIGYQGVGAPSAELIRRLLFDGRYGLLTSAPLLALAVGLPWALPRNGWGIPRRELITCYALTLSYLLFFGAVQYSRLQWVTGIRYLLPVIPFIFLVAAAVLLRVPRVLAYVLVAVTFVITWSMTMVRSQQGILDSVVKTMLGGPQLPALTTLSRMSAQYAAWLTGDASPFAALLVLAAIVFAIWRIGHPWRPLLPAERAAADGPAISRPSSASPSAEEQGV